MAILQSHGILLVDSFPLHAPLAGQATLARLQNTLTFYQYDGTQWLTIRLGAPETYTGTTIPDNADLGTAMQALETALEASIAGSVQGVTGTAVDNTDPLNPIIDLQTAAEVAVADAGGNYTATDVEGVLTEISTQLTGLVHTAITGINLVTTGNANEYTVEISWTDGDGIPQTTTDATPVTISGATDLSYTASAINGTVSSTNGNDATISLADATNAGLQSPADKVKSDLITITSAADIDAIVASLATAIQGVTDTNSINLTKTGTAISADLNISASQGAGVTVTTESDGIKVEVATESKPVGYLSAAAALTALGANSKFTYLAANVDGAVEGTVSWT